KFIERNHAIQNGLEFSKPQLFGHLMVLNKQHRLVGLISVLPGHAFLALDDFFSPRSLLWLNLQKQGIVNKRQNRKRTEYGISRRIIQVPGAQFGSGYTPLQKYMTAVMVDPCASRGLPAKFCRAPSQMHP